MILAAASASLAFRSAILASPISRAEAMMIRTTLAVGVPEPSGRQQPLLMSSAAGGVLRTNVKVRSS